MSSSTGKQENLGNSDERSSRRRCLDDVDDEVRDRAALYLKVYEEPPLVQPYIKEGA